MKPILLQMIFERGKVQLLQQGSSIMQQGHQDNTVGRGCRMLNIQRLYTPGFCIGVGIEFLQL